MCFRPEKLPGLSRNGPPGRIKWKPTPIPRKRQAARRPRRAIFPFLIWWKKDLLILRLFFPRLGTRDAKRQTYQACPSFKGLGLLNYRIQGTFSRYIRWAAQWLGSPYWRATEPLNLDWRATKQAAEPLKYLPFSFFKMLTSTDEPSSH